MVCSTQSIRYNVRGTLQCVTVAKPCMGQMPYTEFMTLPDAVAVLLADQDDDGLPHTIPVSVLNGAVLWPEFVLPE